jgi:hypothetical protein
MDKKQLIYELEFCLKLWGEKGYCKFGKLTKCEQCAAPYLLLKLINNEIIHGDEVKRLTLEDWKLKFQELKNENKRF